MWWFFALSCAGRQVPPAAPLQVPTWAQACDGYEALGVPRPSLLPKAAVALDGGPVLLLGYRDLVSLDPATAGLDRLAPVPWGREVMGLAAARLGDGHVLVLGRREVSPLAETGHTRARLECFDYDPVSDQWAQLDCPDQGMPAEGVWPLAVALEGGQALVHSGASWGVYTPGAGWTLGGLDATPRPTLVALPDGGALVVGSRVQRFDPDSGQLVELEGARLAPAGAVRVGERVLVLRVDGTTRWFDDGRWTEGPSLFAARSSPAVVALADGSVLVSGGWDAERQRVAYDEILAPGAEAWAYAGAPCQPRHLGLLVAVDGGALLVGGTSADAVNSDGGFTVKMSMDLRAERWTPDARSTYPLNSGVEPASAEEVAAEAFQRQLAEARQRPTLAASSEALDALLDQAPPDQLLAVHQARAGLLYERREWTRAAEAYAAAIAAGDDSHEAHNNLAYVLLLAGADPQRALAEADAALAADPDSSYAQDTRGWALHALGRDDEALQVLARVASANRGPVPSAHLGIVAHAAGRDELARENLAAALRLGPSDEPALDAEAAHLATLLGLDVGALRAELTPVLDDLGPLPALSFQVDGREASLDSGVVVLDVWATWCGPCRVALPWLDQVARDYAERGVQVVALSVDSRASQAEAFYEGTQPALVVGWSDTASEALDVEALPTLFLIRDGRVLWRHSGVDLSELPALLDAVAEPAR